MKIFIDVNVFIDVMTKRSGWTESLRVLNLARKSQEIESWTSALTLPLLYFFRRRVADETTARADAQAILKGLHLVGLSQTILEHALGSAGPDFEDNIQIASAESIFANHLITRNKGTLIPGRSPCLIRTSGSSYKKSPHSKPSSRDLPVLPLPSPHRSTRSALASTFGGIVRPICLAALRLMISSNFIGCSTGRSAGLAPFRILST